MIRIAFFGPNATRLYSATVHGCRNEQHAEMFVRAMAQRAGVDVRDARVHVAAF